MSVLFSISAFGKSYEPIVRLYDGQCYGDTIHYRVDSTNTATYYDVLSESDFIKKQTSRDYFLYIWACSIDVGMKYFTLDDNTLVGTYSGKSQTAKAIELTKLPVLISHTNFMESTILKLFPENEIRSGFVIGVVDRKCTMAYDMTSRTGEYVKKGSVIDWNGAYYETIYGTVTFSKVLRLDNVGLQSFCEDLVSGQLYISEKTKETAATTRTLPDTSSNYATETLAFIDSTAYRTNSTVVVDPYFRDIKSVLKFTYPKRSNEGECGTYALERLGMCAYPLTVHIVTNGHWYASLSWGENESGRKEFELKYAITDEFNDNYPVEVLVKTPGTFVGNQL